LAYNIIYDYNIFNNIRGYGVLKHLIGCLGAYALWYYHKLEVVYNKYYLKHTMIVSHKPISLLEIWHFAIVLCNWFPVACDTCNWKFAQLRTTSCMKFAVACDSRIIQVHTVGLYGFIHPYSILAVGRATACNYRGCVHTALHVN
jgi:hypothetical protein